ncbi:SprT-like domain-containing protein [Thermosipho sp. (in: thermotogales)]|jgi:predicted SprT family Zn-dependent metalloprotease|uniref:SprT-like domain-containing protein n=1 Tax=Thermosipho sp. (in: thermotogales) TaxID=1968895 RepID=UPI00257E20E3|nr:SprT-like domain-containing protein [Thermosipho sp. (in: thermotogales)]MBZ4649271.1 metal-dependent hydrolase [Thermosipho sp. (in: thermotogales)]
MLPSESTLKKYYKEIKDKYFGDEVPDVDEVKIEWSKRLVVAAGGCYVKRKIIRLSVPYHEKFPDEIINTLTHEMIHLISGKHNDLFKYWMNKINMLGGHVTLHSKEAAVVNYIYECVNCGFQYKLRKKLKNLDNYHCGQCKSKLKMIKVNKSV